MSAAAIRAWVFDLDNTLYPAEASIYPAIGVRMTAYIARALDCDTAQALELRDRYFHLYGATVLGLAKHHDIDAADFLHDVHQVDLSELSADAELGALINALPGTKYIFTNGDERYGRAVAERLGLADCMTDIVGIDTKALRPKPDPAAYEMLLARTGVVPESTLYFDDHARNLETAHARGFRTALIGDAPKPAFVDYAARDVRQVLRLFAV